YKSSILHFSPAIAKPMLAVCGFVVRCFGRVSAEKIKKERRGFFCLSGKGQALYAFFVGLVCLPRCGMCLPLCNGLFLSVYRSPTQCG
ncbi:MAG: hypothetical protein QM664_11515, partial [Flavihumibacter sp.]